MGHPSRPPRSVRFKMQRDQDARSACRKAAFDDRASSTNRGSDVDVVVIEAEGGAAWRLTDLLGRHMGNIRENTPHEFTIYPEDHGFQIMADIQRGPYASLDAALAEIERHTRGVCRRSTGEDQP